MREEVFGYGLDVDSVVDPDEMEFGVLRNDGMSATDKLFREGGDVRAVLGRDEP